MLFIHKTGAGAWTPLITAYGYILYNKIRHIMVLTILWHDDVLKNVQQKKANVGCS